MFTGIIEYLATITNITKNTIHVLVPNEILSIVKRGDSISINGCCLTIVEILENILVFNLSEETINKTTFIFLSQGDSVHLELALSRDRIDGHILTGHIHGIIFLISRQVNTDSTVLIFSCKNCKSILKYKDCVAIDGVSLTVNNVSDQHFSVSIIPYTQQHTLLTSKSIGTPYNVEFNINTNVTDIVSVDYMLLAKMLANKGRITTPPNPWVGCVIVDDRTNQIISQGYHVKCGEKHAETNAIDKIPIDYDTNNCTLYCTLEPCHNKGPNARQPACTNAIIKSKIPRVVIGILDPDTRVSGNGVAALRTAGIDVNVINHPKILSSLTPYICQRTTKRPYVVVKMAIGLDGRIGVKEVISNCKSKLKVHKLRSKSQAILIGTSTALVDDPRLNIRLREFDPTYISTSQEEHKPLRCFLDRTGKFTDGNLLNKDLGPTVIFTNLNSVDKNVLNIWKSHECEIVDIDTENNHLKLDQILDYLGNRGIIQLLVEGGGELVSDFFQKNLVNRLYLFVTPKLLGTGPLIYNGLPFDKFKLIKHKILENDVQLIYDITNKQ